VESSKLTCAVIDRALSRQVNGKGAYRRAGFQAPEELMERGPPDLRPPEQ
jgi:hypothetical protein